MASKFIAQLRYSGPFALITTLAACGGGGYSDSQYVAPQPAVSVKTAVMSPTQEIAEVSSLATGTGTLSMDASIGSITGSIMTSDMTATAAHIHAGVAGANGAIIVGLVQDMTLPARWNVPANTVLTVAQQALFNSGGLYFNAHSAAFASGEIRGQIGREVAVARLSGVQEVSQNSSTASGLGVISIDPITRLADVTLTFSGITPVGAHIHSGVIGANGPIIFDLGTPAGPAYSAAALQFSEAQLSDFRAKGQYFNLHSAALPGGEIRGQVGYQVRIAGMTGAQENPPASTASTGVGFAAYDPQTKNVFAQQTLTGFTPTLGHMHRGATGASGPVIIGFQQNATNPQVWATNGLVPLADADATLLMSQGLYLNSHSAGFPGGEVRGQLLGNR